MLKFLRIVCMGKVGTGWLRAVSSQIRKRLDTVVSPKSKLTRPIKRARLFGLSRLSWLTSSSELLRPIRKARRRTSILSEQPGQRNLSFVII
jgi:hypothetical protein